MDRRYAELHAGGLQEPSYGGPAAAHVTDGCDKRLGCLAFDPSPAALRLWNFLLTEEDRLRQARQRGQLLVGTMKDLGTVPVMGLRVAPLVAFYPDGAWWIPCVMELSDGLFRIADGLGIDESFCPVRAMLGAFITEAHFPKPDLLTCSVGATCDDFSAIAQRLEAMGHPTLWWEMPHRRAPDPGEPAIALPGGFLAPASQVALVKPNWRACDSRSRACRNPYHGRRLAPGHPRRQPGAGLALPAAATGVRRRSLPPARPGTSHREMLAIHFCSDREETIAVLKDLLEVIQERVRQRGGPIQQGAARISG